MPLTAKAKKKYLKAGGHCPYCNSENIEGGLVEITEGSANQEITCNDCNKRWFDMYTLTDILELKE